MPLRAHYKQTQTILAKSLNNATDAGTVGKNEASWQEQRKVSAHRQLLVGEITIWSYNHRR
jgi:hypothetical protein